MMLISRQSQPVVKELIQKMGFEMTHAHFALCFLYLQGGEGDRTGLVRSIEDFSDEECTLYAAELQENREYIVLMNFQEEEQCRDLLELLYDSLESREPVGTGAAEPPVQLAGRDRFRCHRNPEHAADGPDTGQRHRRRGRTRWNSWRR